jgi:hypothetical protein
MVAMIGSLFLFAVIARMMMTSTSPLTRLREALILIIPLQFLLDISLYRKSPLYRDTHAGRPIGFITLDIWIASMDFMCG